MCGNERWLGLPFHPLRLTLKFDNLSVTGGKYSSTFPGNHLLTFANKLRATLTDTGAGLRRWLALPDVTPIAPLDYPFADSDVAQLHRVMHDPANASLDEQTWNDLMLAPYLDSLCASTSIFGRQELYRRLRAGLDDSDCAALGARLRALQADSGRQARIAQALQALRQADTEVAGLLFEGAAPTAPPWLGWTWLLPLALLASLAGVILTPASWLGTAVVLYLLIALQMRHHEQFEEWKRSLGTVQALLVATSTLGDGADGLPDAATRAARLNRRLSRSLAARMSPDGGAYGDWFMLANVKHYFTSSTRVFEERAFLLACYRHCAALEADLALARHLAAGNGWCWAERSAAGVVEIEDGRHPLLPAPAVLSIALCGKGAFISGPNGVGKSTFLRMLGLNLVAARAFGFCYAARARLPPLPVYASMQNDDSLLEGQSLYMAELARARALLDAANGPHPGICLIDEIFRGTNHVESVAAAAAVLDTLAARTQVVVSSHNVVLASLLEHRLAAYRIERSGPGTLALVPGVLVRTNGIALLRERGFDTEVSARAEKVAAWLTGYLGHPDAGAHVLARVGEGSAAA